MLRIVRFFILPGVLLTACAVSVFADATPNSNAARGKQMYSNRPVGYTIVAPYYGTPMVPHFMVPPDRIAVAQAPVKQPELAPVPIAPIAPIVPPVQVGSQATQVVEKTTYILREPKPEVNVNDELDTFYARLAKIQLEKHNLTDALTLVQRIKSETTKVRTIVDFAEYVSRDRNYQAEAEQLYRLAIAGMEALNQKQPFNVGVTPAQVVTPVTLPVQTSAPVQPIIPVQPEPVVITPPATVTVPTEPAIVPVKPQPILLDDEPITPLPPVPTVQPNSPDPRPPILLPEDSAGVNGNGKKILPPPDPPRDETNGIVVSPPTKPSSSEPAPPALSTSPASSNKSNGDDSPRDQTKRPLVILDELPESKPITTPLAPITLDEN